MTVNAVAQLTRLAVVSTAATASAGKTNVYSAASRADTATVTSGSATISDTAITAADLGKAVSGVGIPAASFVGAVTAGASFALVNSSGTSVTATAAGTAISVGGAIAPVLPPLTTGAIATALAAGQLVRLRIQKSRLDSSPNAVTVTCAGSDVFESGAATVALTTPGEKLTLVATTLPGGSSPVWVIDDHTVPRDALDLRYWSINGQETLRTQNDAAMRPFRAALAGAKRGKQQATVCVFGDSKSEGQNSDSGATYQDVWTRYLLTSLRAKWQPAGVTGGDGFIPAKYAYANPTGQGFALAGTSGTDYSIANTYGPGARNVSLKTTSGILSITKTFTSADLYIYNATAATKIDVTIDGTTTTYTTNSTGSNQKISIGTGLAATSHTLTIKQGTSSPGWVQVNGVDFFNGDETAGVRFLDSSHYGYTTAQALSILGNIVPSLVLAAPDLVVMKLGTNDYTSIDAATFEANLLQIMKTNTYSFVNRFTKVPSYLIVVPEARSSMVSPIAAYVQAAYNVAAAMPTPTAVLDLSQRLPQAVASSPLGIWSSDAIHETSLGYQYVADAIERVLLG